MHVRRPIMFGTTYFEVYVRHNTLKKGDNVCSSTVEHKLGAEHNLGADHFGAELTSFWYIISCPHLTLVFAPMVHVFYIQHTQIDAFK